MSKKLVKAVTAVTRSPPATTQKKRLGRNTQVRSSFDPYSSNNNNANTFTLGVKPLTATLTNSGKNNSSQRTYSSRRVVTDPDKPNGLDVTFLEINPGNMVRKKAICIDLSDFNQIKTELESSFDAQMELRQ